MANWARSSCTVACQSFVGGVPSVPHARRHNAIQYCCSFALIGLNLRAVSVHSCARVCVPCVRNVKGHTFSQVCPHETATISHALNYRSRPAAYAYLCVCVNDYVPAHRRLATVHKLSERMRRVRAFVFCLGLTAGRRVRESEKCVRITYRGKKARRASHGSIVCIYLSSLYKQMRVKRTHVYMGCYADACIYRLHCTCCGFVCCVFLVRVSHSLSNPLCCAAAVVLFD